MFWDTTITIIQVSKGVTDTMLMNKVLPYFCQKKPTFQHSYDSLMYRTLVYTMSLLLKLQFSV
jgi:hypothetical protein